MFQVAIVGRPNVGKSTLFNRLCGFRKAIVGDEAGITRDRIYGSVRWNGKPISVLDTGGMIPETHDIIPEKILNQVATAISESRLVLLVVDGRVGITPLDQQLLPMMRKLGKPIWTVVNKIDTPELESHAASFHEFGTEQVYAISAEHGRGTAELLDAIAAGRDFQPGEGEEDKEAGDKLGSIVGRPV
jgi:GTP-binding protein